MAKPMPWAPPVMTATWPLRSIWFMKFIFLGSGEGLKQAAVSYFHTEARRATDL